MSVQIQISYKELTETKRFLDNQPRIRNVSLNGSRPETNGRVRTISDETKRLIIRDLTPYKQPKKKHSNVSYPNNHGILRIPKEIDSILRCENAKHVLRRSSSNSTQDNWVRFNQCATQLGDVCRQKECAPISMKLIPRAKSLCEEMCQLAAHIIQSDYEFCESHSVEYALWHRGVSVVTECLKERSKISNEYSKEFFSYLISIRDYYAALISSVQSINNFSLSVLDSINSIPPGTEQNKILRGALTCHFCYLALGDILMYLLVLKERNPDAGVSQEYDWSAVTGYYQKALQLAPTNGSTYTQLSILSSNQQYYLDTIFYSVRSLTANNPMLEVSETLVHIFQSIEEKSTSLQSRERQESPATPPKHNTQCDNEVWIIPDDSKLNLKKAAHFRNIVSPVNFQKLFKDMYSSFLTIQAKLYTNIGIDSVPDWLSVFDCSLSSLLKNRCNQSLSEILLKMQLIALYSLTNQNTPSKSAQQYKVDFLFSFHFLLVQSMQRNIQCESDVPSHTWYLLPHLRVFIQWLRHNTELDYWQTFSNHKLWNLLCKLSNQLVSLQLPAADNNTFLWEDQLLSGCLLTKFINTRISWATVELNIEDSDSIQYRISLITSNLIFLSNSPNFPIYFNPQLSMFDLQTHSKPEDDVNTDVINTVSPQIGSSEGATGRLNLRSDEEECLPADTGIWKHTVVKHEISPRFIVPDTNCFLSHLSLLQQLHTSTNLQLTVPLIVLQELEHLRVPISKSQKHFSSCSRAKDAYSWLMEEFSSPKHNLLALTNQGNLIDTPYSQDFSSVRNQINDDLILQSCVKLNQTWHKPSDPDCVRSCVVLLTSDRNLRLKAVTQSLPAKSIKRFLCLINYTVS